jgi:cell division protein FtsI/penicillin-binding protein 2
MLPTPNRSAPSPAGSRAAGSPYRLAFFFLAAFGLLIAALGYWTLIARDALIARNDNPRALIAFNRIQRGRILDRSGQVLAESSGLPGDYVRRYELSSALVVGYASFRYGLSGIEAAADTRLSGLASQDELSRWWRYEVLGEPQIGGDVPLTLDLDGQRAAFRALNGQPGAIVKVDTPGGEIRVMASSPAFDPAQIDEQFESFTADSNGPLISRATLGLYQADALLRRFPRTLDLGQTPALPLPVRPAEGRRLTPLHMALLAAATANQGLMPAPRLLVDQPAAGSPIAVMAGDEAEALAAVFRAGVSATIPSGFEDETLGWYVALKPATGTPGWTAVCIVLENATGAQAAAVAELLYP